MGAGKHVDSNIHLRAKSVRGSFLEARGIEGIDDLFKAMDRMGNFSKHQLKEIQTLHKLAGKEIKKAIQSEITSHPKSINIKRTGKNEGKRGPDYTIIKGTLRRSIKVFKAKGARLTYLVGPRSQATFEYKELGSVIKSDGYFAHIVNDGLMPTLKKGTKGFSGGRGMQSGSPNKGFFERGIAKGIPPAYQILVRGYSVIMERILSK